MARHTNRNINIALGALMASGSLITGCADNLQGVTDLKPALETRFLAVDWEPPHFTSDAASTTFNVYSAATPWRISGHADWLDISPLSGSSSAVVNMKLQENPIAEPRTSLFTIKSEAPDLNWNRALSVSQGEARAWVTLEKNSLTYTGAGGTDIIDVQSNCEWTVDCSRSWVTAIPNPEAKTLEIQVAPNTTSSERSAYVYVRYGNGDTQTLSIQQAVPVIASETTSIEFGNDVSWVRLTLASEAGWTASTQQTWIQVTPESGEAGSTEVTIEVTANESIFDRTGQVVFQIGDSNVTHTVSITQRGIYIDLPAALDFNSDGGTAELEIGSNTEWEVNGWPEWLELDATAGKGDAKLTITCAGNESSVSRTGKITVTAPGVDIVKETKVTQKGKYIAVAEDYLSFDDKAGSKAFTIESDTKWTSTASADWFSATPAEGIGKTEVTVTVEENSGDADRTGTLTYNWLDQQTVVSILQTAKYLRIDNESFHFDSHGGTHKITVSTTDDWTATADEGADWLQLSATSGTGEGEITLTVPDNPSVTAREAAIFIATPFSQGYRIIVKQDARYLTLSTSSLAFFSKGGVSEPIFVQSDGTYEIKAGQSWISIDKNEEEGSFTVTVQPNETGQTREGTVTVSLTDLANGSYSLTLAVIQAPVGGTYVINPYPTDTDWSAQGTNGITVKVEAYGTDADWDKGLDTSLKVTKEAYGTDGNWGAGGASSGTIGQTGHGEDSNCGAGGNSSGTIGQTGHGEDSDWGNGGNSGGTIGKTGHGEDENWNGTGSGSSNVTQTGYGEPDDWSNDNPETKK